MAIYDHIGDKYDKTRCADPYIVLRLVNLLKAIPTGTYLDVACGTGNYTAAITNSGFKCHGIDNSLTMLTAAQLKHDQIVWYQGDAQNMPLSENAFDGAFCVLGIHHIGHLENLFQEIFRVIAKGRFVIFTSTPEQMRKYWLNEYFPIALERSAIQMPPLNQIRQALRNVGFKIIDVEPYSVRKELQDHFLYSGKHRPESYLDPSFREGISTFRLLIDAEELESGCDQLREDIQTGQIANVMDAYDNSDGDYMFIVSEVG